MGLLDDAIREHLELKRRRGADPTEVERAEREALGPVRRGPEEPLMPSAEAEDANGYDVVEEWDEAHADDPRGGSMAIESYEDDEYDEYDDEPVRGDASPVIPPAADLAPGDADLLEPEVGGSSSDAATAPPLRFAEEPGAGPLPHHAPAAPDLDDLQKTAEHAVEPRPGDSAVADEDVLEETPEFLQDTPDHDRLWFEQRPPRDFDFDG
jgi:hypothetical protein